MDRSPEALAKTGYTKAEIDAQQNAQDTKITVNNDEIARQQIEITNNTAGIVKNDGAINTNITSTIQLILQQHK